MTDPYISDPTQTCETDEDAKGWIAQAKESVTSVPEKVSDYVQQNPYQALAIAAGIGFVAGLILKRR